MRILILFAAVLLLSITSFAQSGGFIKGKVTDRKEQPLERASVSLLNAADSSVVLNVFTDIKGAFTLHDLKENKYLLLVTYLGYQQIQKLIMITPEKLSVDLGTLIMKEKSVDLKGVTVTEIAPPVALKGDTLEFNAGSFQTRPNAVVQDLLAKIPGLQINKDGTVTAEGETVTQIYVDGKPFFGTDPKLALQNLPVNVIDKVQVFDKTSDQAAFTGIDDGNTTKAINLTIKKDKKKGLFGRVSAGGGTDDRFAANASLFHFNNDQQISFLGSGNNTNNLGFTFNDIRSFYGGGGGGGGRGGGRPPGGAFLGGMSVPGQNGETTAWMAGLNYRDQWGKKLTVTGDYFFNNTSNNVMQDQDLQYVLPDTSYYNNQKSHSLNNSTNQRFDMRMTYQIDSSSSLLFTPSVSYTANNYAMQSTYNALDSKQLPVNQGSNHYTNNATSPNISGNLLYRKKFNKAGRTLSVNLNGGYNTNNADGINQSNTQYFQGSGKEDSVNQTFVQDNTGKNWGANITYTEPLSTYNLLEFHAGHSYNLSLSDKNTFNQNPFSGKFDRIDSVYSNSFRNTFNTNTAGINFQTKKLRYNYTLGLNVRQNELTSYSITGDSAFKQNTVNLYPQAFFNYTFTKNRRLRFYYRGTTQQPSLSQLQPVPDNSNPLNIKVGNPDLKPSFTNSFRLNYRSFDMSNYHMFFAMLNFSTVSDDIVNASSYNNSGQQTTQYVNANGNYNGSAFITAGLPIRDSKNMINSRTSFNFGRDVSFINAAKSIAKTWSVTQGLDFNYAYKELFDFRLAGSVNYNNASYSLQKNLNTNYFNYEGSLDFNINLPAHFMIQTDFDYTANTGRAAGYNQNIAMWNASVQKYIFPKQQGLIKLQAFDILNQHTSITRNITANYIEDVRTNVIPQYFMLSFTYFLNKFPGQESGKGMRGFFFRPDRFRDGI
ncbi:MAG: TonB-dependent receptor [Chitinophagaceae bacterium]|nr:MAG: TonB-dependent receptor [Chitinophagaceae bacterium]